MYLDISLPIHNQTIIWPRDPKINITTSLPGESNVILSQLNIGAHTGTHIDAPRHFIPQGKTLEQFPIERFIGPCQVINIKSSSPEITLNDFKPELITPKSRILFKTKNSKLLESNQFNPQYTSLSIEVAQFLADRQIWLVGIDYLSIEPYNNLDHPIHKLLFAKDILILESIYLDHVPKGQYQLICLPLNLHNTEAAPCRAILKPIK